MLYVLFNSSGNKYKKERSTILALLAHGLRHNEVDYYNYFLIEVLFGS